MIEILAHDLLCVSGTLNSTLTHSWEELNRKIGVKVRLVHHLAEDSMRQDNCRRRRRQEAIGRMEQTQDKLLPSSVEMIEKQRCSNAA